MVAGDTYESKIEKAGYLQNSSIFSSLKQDEHFDIIKKAFVIIILKT